MNKTLTSIFETQGPVSLNISNQRFLKEDIFEEFIDCCFFHQVNFINCSFEECELLGVNFDYCSFEGCTFKNTIIRKSEVTDCVFKNCQFIDSLITPRVNFFQTLFMNSQFLSVDFSSTFFYECKFISINLTKIKFRGTSIVDPETKNVTFNDLEFDKTDPMRIRSTNSLSFPIVDDLKD